MPPEFEPKPANDFRDFVASYYTACRQRFPRIAAIADKTAFEDLIPGLSDVDPRFVLQDGMALEDWCEMAAVVGETHLDICRRHPRWVRNLEHLPGLNLTWSELLDPATYSPEYHCWAFLETATPDRVRAAGAYLQRRPWGRVDEWFYLRKFCSYCSRYDRDIDPPVNIGRFEGKYPLHSRCIHYFAPAVHAALCLILRQPLAGKLEALRTARELFPGIRVFGEVREAIERHYEIPELYREPAITGLDDRMEEALHALRTCVARGVTLVPDATVKTVREWRSDLDHVPRTAAARLFDSVKFLRLTKGRLWFYGNAPVHFENAWVLENEFRSLRRIAVDEPLGAFFENRPAVPCRHITERVPELCPDVLTQDEVTALRKCHRLLLAGSHTREREAIARELSQVFAGVLSGLTKLFEWARGDDAGNDG